MAITLPGQTYVYTVTGAGPTLISNANDNRRHVMLANNGAVTVFFAWGPVGNEAVANQTFPLAPSTIYESNAYPGGKSLPRGALSAVTAGGSCVVCYEED